MTVDRQTASRGPWRCAAAHRRPGISLAEMMIAVVILGLGLLMVATLFPVSWLSARRLAEHTTTLSCAEAAQQALQTLLKVDGSDTEAAMLPGDQVLIGDCPGCTSKTGFEAGSVKVNGDTGSPIARVHTLNLGNILAEGTRAFVAENSWDLERTRLAEEARDRGYDYPEFQPQGNCGDSVKFKRIPNFLDPAVALQHRVYPPMPNRPSSDFTNLAADNLRWDAALAGRRYAWSVLYRFDDEYVCQANRKPCGDGSYELADIGQTRALTLFHVVLRRPRPTLRYARQDPEIVPHPDPREAIKDGPTPIQALGSDQDLMFPVPWRVQVLFPEKRVLKTKATATGVPTEITVNDEDEGRIDDTSPAWVTGIFERGTMFIDELTGQVYRVEKRRLSDDDKVGHLTLDREVTVEDIDFGDCDISANDKLDDEERLRTVWVFPPPVEGNRSAGDPLVFDGSPPVVDIIVRTLAIVP